jgi:hypothetical protein
MGIRDEGVVVGSRKEQDERRRERKGKEGRRRRRRRRRRNKGSNRRYSIGRRGLWGNRNGLNHSNWRQVTDTW